MSKTKKKIRLVAEKITFTRFSVIYHIEDNPKIKEAVPFCPDNIKDKDLILKPTLVSRDDLRVVYAFSDVTPHFYQSILDGSIRNLSEYETEKANIYLKGDVVAYILVD